MWKESHPRRLLKREHESTCAVYWETVNFGVRPCAGSAERTAWCNPQVESQYR